jgi:hypothetical protein
MPDRIDNYIHSTSPSYVDLYSQFILKIMLTFGVNHMRRMFSNDITDEELMCEYGVTREELRSCSNFAIKKIANHLNVKETNENLVL